VLALLDRGPGVLFERVGQSDMRVVGNLLTSRARFARGLGVAPDALARAMCQSAPKIAPSSASKTDPLVACSWVVVLAPSELVGVARTGRARVQFIR